MRLRRARGLLLPRLAGRDHVGDETVAAPRQRLHVLGAVEAGERPAQRGDVLGEAVLLDVTVRPDAIDQLALRHHAAGVLDEIAERLEGLHAERHLGRAGSEDALRGVELERPEMVRLHAGDAADYAGLIVPSARFQRRLTTRSAALPRLDA
jgi:hypothetical protein